MVIPVKTYRFAPFMKVYIDNVAPVSRLAAALSTGLKNQASHPW